MSASSGGAETPPRLCCCRCRANRAAAVEATPAGVASGGGCCSASRSNLSAVCNIHEDSGCALGCHLCVSCTFFLGGILPLAPPALCARLHCARTCARGARGKRITPLPMRHARPAGTFYEQTGSMTSKNNAHAMHTMTPGRKAHWRRKSDNWNPSICECAKVAKTMSHMHTLIVCKHVCGGIAVARCVRQPPLSLI